MRKNTHRLISRRDFLKMNLVIFAAGLLGVPFRGTPMARRITLKWKTRGGVEGTARYRRKVR